MNKNENGFKELDEIIFKKAIFETIRLWCFSEYNYHNELEKAYNSYNLNKKLSINDDFVKLYDKFLDDYSIVRTRKSGKSKDILKIIFDTLNINKEFSPKIVDDIAKELKVDCTPNQILPISLVSKTVFLAIPRDAILYDSRGLYSIHKIFKGKKIIKDQEYQEYYNIFKNLYDTYKTKALLLIDEVLKSNKQTIKAYFSTYYKLFNKNEFVSSFSIMDEENIDWLYQRCLDKYLWYYYEFLISNKNNN